MALVAAPLAVGFTAPAAANVDVAVATVPYTQDWSNVDLISANDNWSAVVGVQGYRGDGMAAATGVDPRTVLVPGGLVTNVIANGAPSSTAGGVLEAAAGGDNTIALQGSGTARVPHAVFRLDLTGKTGVEFSFDARDIDATTDNSVQPIAVQYRVGGAGNYTNLADGYIADASSGPSLAQLVTHRDVLLPPATDNQGEVYVRVLTADAVGSDEWIGIDNISIADTSGPLAAADPGDKAVFADTPMPSFAVKVSGGTKPYSWAASGLPAGVTISEGGVVAGTPTATGTFEVTATVTDNKSATASTTFDIVVAAPDPLVATTPGNKSAYVSQTMPSFTMSSTGGAPSYSWTATGLPAGVTMSAAGVVSGTPAVEGTFPVTAKVTDGGSRTAETMFDLTVVPVPARTIADLQGTGSTSPFVDDFATTEGVVTAAYTNNRYGTGSSTHLTELGGFYIQTGGNPDTAGASDAIFVFMGAKTPPAIGDSVRVTGKVTEYFGLTEISPSKAGDVVVLQTPLPAVVPGTDLPGTTCTAGDCPDAAELAALREAHEGEAFLPTGDYTVSDSYDGSAWAQAGSLGFAMQGEIGLAANSIEPLVIGTEEIPADDTTALAEHNAWNEAHRVTLDDGADVDYTASSVEDVAGFPWLTPTNSPRVGAKVTFAQPLIFTYRFDMWRLDTRTRVVPGTDGTAQGVAFEDTRALNATPDDVLGTEGNLKIATFNMLNYFPVTGEEYVDSPSFDPNPVDPNQPRYTRKCSYYTDRLGDRVSNNECGEYDLAPSPDALMWPGPRGAAQKSGGTDLTASTADFERQQAKEIEAINTMDADVMSLEEVENSSKIIDGRDRDAAVSHLVDVLNADWAASHPGESNRWAFVPSPRPAAQPTLLEQDAIRSAFIYNPNEVETIGASRILVNSAPFRNAREPLAQAFVRKGGSNADGFAVIVNHFKSKGGPSVTPTVPLGDNDDTGNGAGFYNGDRVRQAKALVAFANDFLDDKQIEAAFLTGDYNAYSQEDPVKTIVAAGYEDLHPANGQKTYSFGGLAGSLDHVFANTAAQAWVTGKDVWEINSNESVYYEYSRYNANLTNLYAPHQFRASDHNPEIIGINAPKTPPAATVDTVQVLASNDFHGRLLDDPGSASAGAAAMAGAVKGLRAANGNTAFVMAGDIVGASTFESFIQNDKPTIDAMNEAGLEVSAAGNHEFDQGYDDLMGRIMSATDPGGGAEWPYIAANVRKDGEYALATDRTDGNFAHSNGATWWKDFPTLDGGAGVKVGFVGAVTQDLDSLVAPDAIAGLEITSIVDEVNAAAADLKTDGCGGEPCDLVIELVHEGAPSPSCATIKTDADSTFGRIVHGASDEVDAIISGHTHLKYNCKVPVTGKLDRPVVSAGQYGSYLNQLEFDFAPGTDDLVGIRQHVLAMKDYDEDAATKTIVGQAVQVADAKGAVDLGQVAGPFKRARRVDPQSGVVENRGGESTLGNLVAEMQRWKTGADIGVMNPGGLRDDLIGTGDAAGPVTYREAANVQPFANTLVTVDLTGAQVKLLLEQQWQRDPDNNIPSRPFLRLGTSKGFTWTEDASKAEGDRITGMWLDGVAIDPAATYTVSANSFLAVGGDNFQALTLGTNKQDTGKTDLQATVDYLDEFANSTEGDAPLPVDYEQHGVGARVSGGPFAAGETVAIALDSLSMTGGGTSADVTDLKDTEVVVSYEGDVLGTFPVSTSLPTTPYDTPGFPAQWDPKLGIHVT